MGGLILRCLILGFVCFLSLSGLSTEGFSRDDDSSDQQLCYEVTHTQSGRLVNQLEARATLVVDGDTIRILYRNRRFNIRFLSIDTPETHYLGQSQGYWGEKAHEYLAELLPNGTDVTIELDQESCDQYGRILGHVWKDNENINRRMIESGLAVNYCIYPNQLYCAEYASIVEENIREKKGIFGDPGFELPYLWRQRVSGRSSTKFVGNVFSKEVFPPGSLDSVPVSSRIFFWTQSQIEEPYHMMR